MLKQVKIGEGNELPGDFLYLITALPILIAAFWNEDKPIRVVVSLIFLT
jgi:hypothetical protein